MVKREKSPEIADDARYFTVYQPYPLSQTWEDEDTQKECASWIAECIGQQYLWAMHTKPSARNMILLEVSKDFEDHSRLLGEHRWKDFLKDPTEEEKERFSRVFHSFYSRGRDAQKDGWKPIVVENKWFGDWKPGRDRIVQPYPTTHWCPTPPEDKTQKTLCRPLPAEQKLPPPRPQAVVVGSKDWVVKQGDAPPSRAALTRAWSKGGTPTSIVIPLPTETERTSSGASTPSIQANSPLSSAPASPAIKGKTIWGRTMPLQKFVNDAVRSNNKMTPGWAAMPTKSLSGKSPLAEEPSKGSVNAWTRPLVVPEAGKAKPSTAVKHDSKAKTKNDYSECAVKDTLQGDMHTNANLPKESRIAVGVPSTSPKKGRNRGRKEIREDKRSSPLKDGPFEGPQVPDSREKKSQWDVPGPEKSTKHLPKPWDKKKKEKETVETMEFGVPLDWSAYKQMEAPDDEPMDVDGEGQDELVSRSDNNTYQDEKTYDFTENNEGKSKDAKLPYKNDNSHVRTEDAVFGTSGDFSVKQVNGAGFSKRNKLKAKKEKLINQERIAETSSAAEIHGSTQNGKNIAAVDSDDGGRRPVPTDDKDKKPALIPIIAKRDPSPPTPGNNKLDDFGDWGHAPHKKRLAAMTRTAEAQASMKDEQDRVKVKGVDMDKVSEILAPYDMSKKNDDMDNESPVEVDTANEWKYLIRPSDNKTRKSKFSLDIPSADTPMDQDDNEISSKTNEWGADSNEMPSSGKDKERATLPDDLGTRPEDYSLEPESGSSSVPLRTNETLDDDDVNWNAPQENYTHWNLAPDLILGRSDDLNETELYAWERENPAQPAAPEAPRAPLSNKYLKTLKCPTHNYYCKKSICKDMARLVKEEEYKAKMGIPSNGQGFKDHVMHEVRKPPTRPRGSKRGPRVRARKDPSTLGQLRGFESDNDSEDDAEDKPERTYKGEGKGKQGSRNDQDLDNEAVGTKRSAEEEPIASSSKLDASNIWGVPIGSNISEWGVQSNLDDWMS